MSGPSAPPPVSCNICSSMSIHASALDNGVGTKSVVCAKNKKIILVPRLEGTRLWQLESIKPPRNCPLRAGRKEVVRA